MSSPVVYDTFETLRLERPAEGVLHVQLNRPDKRNAMNTAFWYECRRCFEQIALDSDVRAVVVSGNGPIFTAGLDLTDVELTTQGSDPARSAYYLRRKILEFQEAFTAIEECPKPVIAAIHSACVGGGVDLVTACCIRYCSADTFFSIKEVDVGLAADVGTLQRLPKIVGNDSIVRELAYTARRLPAAEALQLGLVGRVFESKEATLAYALKVATEVAGKSPVAVVGTKLFMNHARDHTTREGLSFAATWNMAMLSTDDLPEAVMATRAKRPAAFAKL